MAGHFSGLRLFKAVVRTWWWEGLYKNAMAVAKSRPQCVFSRGTGRVRLIPVQRPFQIWGVDILELPRTQEGNHYAVVFQDFFTKWPLVFPTPDQKSLRIARLLAEELVPTYVLCPWSFAFGSGSQPVVPFDDRFVDHAGDSQVEHHIISHRVQW